MTSRINQIGFARPVLWINDDSYAAWAARVTWPVLHDITDDWFAASATPRELARRRCYEEILKSRADVRVAVSQRLVETRGSSSSIQLIPDAVDVAHFHTPQDRPRDLPKGPHVTYVGTLHEDRIDLDLVAALARAIAPVPVVLVGPNAMSSTSTRALESLPNCYLLGPRPYANVPAYYQHADVIVVPHRVSDFTESLDPIKIYECLAVGRPTVATPVAGFRGQGPPIFVADATEFAGTVRQLLASAQPAMPGSPPTWEVRAVCFEEALLAAMRVREESTHPR